MSEGYYLWKIPIALRHFGHHILLLSLLNYTIGRNVQRLWIDEL